MRRGTRATLAALGIALPPATALAGDPTLAEALFQEGKALMRAHDYAHACPKLEESYRQDEATGTLLALGMCHEASGNLASAWAAYNAVIGPAERQGRTDRAQAARRRALSLEPRLSTLTVDVPADVLGLAGLTISRDGVRLPEAAWNAALPVDPGEHVVEVHADGKLPSKQSVTLGAEADRQTVRVGTLEPTQGKPVVTPVLPATTQLETPASATLDSTRSSRAPSPGHAEVPSSTSTLRWVGFGVGGIGVVALGVGAVYGLRAKSLDEDSKADGHCDAETGCDSYGDQLNGDALSAGRTATALFIAGGALVAGGVVLYLVGSASEPAMVSLRVSPEVIDSGARLAVRGRF